MKLRAGLLFFWISLTLLGQQLPPLVRWKEINTGHFRVIYPQEIDSTAKKTAAFLEHSYWRIGWGLHHRSRRIPVILNPYYALANGYSALMPRRTEWYMTPGNFGRAWYKELGVHEIRHIFQFDAMNRHLVKWGYIMGGEFGQLLTMGLTYPMWFFEGDAVYTETMYGGNGRGFSGRFAAPMKAIALEYPPKKRNYYDFYLRSYKTYYPSHYHLGYHLVAYVNRRFPNVKYSNGQILRPWDDIINKASWYGGIPGGMNLELMTDWETSYRRLTDSLMTDLARHWRARLPQIRDSLTYLLPPPRTYTRDIYLQTAGNGDKYFLRYGFDDAPAIMRLGKGSKTEKIKNIPDYSFSLGGKRLAWKTYRIHPRWHNRIWTRIAVYDTETKKTAYWDTRKNYYDLALNGSGNILVLTYNDSLLVPHLEIVDWNTRKTVADRAFPRLTAIFSPDISDNNRLVAFIGQVETQGTGIFLWDTGNGKVYTVLEPQRPSIPDDLNFSGDKLLWTQDYHGVNVWEADLKTGRIRMLTHRPYMALYGSIANDTLYLSDYTVQGFRLAAIPVHQLQTTVRSKVKSRPEDYYNPQDLQMPYISQVGSSPYPNYFSTRANQIEFLFESPLNLNTIPAESHPYKHFRSWFRPHTWAFGPVADTTKHKGIGVFVTSRDYLDETSWAVSATYYNPAYFGWNAQVEFRRWYPVIGFSGGRELAYGKFQNLFRAYVRFPWVFSGGLWQKSLSVQTSGEARVGPWGQDFRWEPRLSVSAFRIKAYRDIHAAGVYAEAAYSHQTGSANWAGSFSATAYWPGPFCHDLLSLGVYLRRVRGDFPSYHSLPVLPALHEYNYRRLLRADLSYQWPWAYPDGGIERLFRLKRLRGGPIAGWAQTGNGQLWGAGLQITGDWNFLGLLADISLGGKILYVPSRRQWYWAVELLGIEF